VKEWRVFDFSFGSRLRCALASEVIFRGAQDGVG
jgi:hypothetical protein